MIAKVSILAFTICGTAGGTTSRMPIGVATRSRDQWHSEGPALTFRGYPVSGARAAQSTPVRRAGRPRPGHVNRMRVAARHVRQTGVRTAPNVADACHAERSAHGRRNVAPRRLNAERFQAHRTCRAAGHVGQAGVRLTPLPGSAGRRRHAGDSQRSVRGVHARPSRCVAPATRMSREGRGAAFRGRLHAGIAH